MRLTSAILVTLAACGTTPPSPSSVRTHITSDLGNVLHEAKAASDATTTNLPTGSAAQLLGLGLGSSTSAARVLAPLARLLAPRSATVADAVPATPSFDPDAEIQWLNDNLFTDANSLGNGVFQVPPALLCTTTSVDANGNTISTVDPDCVQRVTTAELRVRVEQDDSTLRFSLQVDADHDEPLSFTLTHTSLAMTIDLDDATRAMLALAQAFGDQAPNAALAGQVTGELQVLGSAHVELSLTIDRAVTIELADQGADLAGPTATRFTSAQADVLAIELDGSAPRLVLALGLGETTAHLPGDSLTKATDLDLAGLTASATYDGSSTLQIDHISLGNKTTTIAKDGVQAIAIDLNPSDGRELSATLSSDPATGADTLTVSPRLDLQVATDHAALGDTPPEYDVTRVQLDGSLATVPASGVTRVTGSYSIATSPAQFGFAATTGQCVTSTDTYDSTSGQSYTAYSVAACP